MVGCWCSWGCEFAGCRSNFVGRCGQLGRNKIRQAEVPFRLPDFCLEGGWDEVDGVQTLSAAVSSETVEEPGVEPGQVH